MTNRRTGMGSLLVLLAIASLLVSACSQAPTGKEQQAGSPQRAQLTRMAYSR